MDMTRRQILRAMGAASTAAALASCGFTSGDSSSEGGDDELTFTTWGSDSELAGFNRAIEAFQDANPGSTVALNAVPFEQMFTTIDAQLQSDTAPDIFRVDYDNLGTYAGRDQLLDLSPYLDSSTGGQFTDQMWQAVQYDDTPFGLPHHTDTTAILFNTAALESAGITSVPDTLETAWTWEEFAQVAQKLRDDLPDDQYPFAYNWQSQGVTRWLNWLFQADGRFLAEDLVTPAIDSAAGTAAVDFTRDFFPRRFVPSSSSVKSATYASDLFFSETIGMVFSGAFLLPDAEDLAGFEWGATFAPRNERGGSDLGGNALVATAGTTKGELAAEFLSFMTSRDQMADFCSGASLLPTRNDLVEEGIEFDVRPELSPVFLGQASTVQPGDAAQIASRSMAAINTVLADELEQAFTTDVDTADVLSAMSDGIAEATGA